MTDRASASRSESGSRLDGGASVTDALLVYAEAIAAGAHVVLVGDSESPVTERLLELGARSVYVCDPDPARATNAARSAPRGVTVKPLLDELDVRDGAFDLALVPDLAELNDAERVIGRLRRAVAANGAVVAMARARIEGDAGPAPFGGALGPATLAYAELYELFAGQFDDVALYGVVPFRGVVFAELGREEDEAPAVGVDTRFAPALPPSVFVIVAGDAARRESGSLDPYSIVQIGDEATPSGRGEATLALEATLAATQLKAELAFAQLEEARERIAVADARSLELAARLERAGTERDGALTRAMELETVLAAANATVASLENRLIEAERGLLDRDDRIAGLHAELDARVSMTPTTSFAQVDSASVVAEAVRRAERAESALAEAVARLANRPERSDETAQRDAETGGLRVRAERAEAELALNVADLASLAEAHAAETAAYEEQLRDRARFIAALEFELVRREQLVRELVGSLEEAREGNPGSVVFEAAAPLSTPVRNVPDPDAKQEIERLRKKLDELAAENARREGEIVARGWRIAELEGQSASRLEAAEPSGPKSLHDEVDALRKALSQEHEARLAAESGEELARVRAELARQTTLLEQLRRQHS